ncbi:MAG TPA: alginate export family protein [Casimicrobiaceae bacterium]|nr:alginate export family protein [Casimicrobiaceae bacterium]
MGRPREIGSLAAALVLCAGLAGNGAGAQALADAARDRTEPVVLTGSQVPLDLAEGLRVAGVSVRLEGSTGDAGMDTELRRQVEAQGGALRDVPLQRFVAEGLLQRVRGVPGVAQADLAVFQAVPSGRVVLVITVTAAPAPAAGKLPEKVRGLFATGSLDALPVLYQDDRSLLKAILNGGAGVYATSNPFFGFADLFTMGNKAARHPAGPGSTAWAEAYIEPGLGGIFRLGDTPLYPYGSVTYLESASWGQDIYDSGSRRHGAFEQAYGGVVVDLPGKGNAINVSAGRQIYQLRQGFLISKIPGSTNLGSLGALWLGPRLAWDNTVVATLRYGAFTAEGILLEPTEFPGMETGTRLTGGTVGYNDGEIVDAALTFLAVPRSQKPYLAPDGSVTATREGLRTISPSVWLTDVFGVEGLWFKGEFAYQTHEQLDMRAYAYALWPGYRADHLPWKPGISYRFASFSGDDPATATYERYDPLFSGGQNNYVSGMLLSSVLLNANLRSQRLSLTANPSDQFGLTLEYSIHRANVTNNAGAIGPLQQLTSKDLAREVDFFCNVYVGKSLYVQGVLAAAIPGAAIKEAVDGSAKNWYAAQLSLYYFF